MPRVGGHWKVQPTIGRLEDLRFAGRRADQLRDHEAAVALRDAGLAPARNRCHLYGLCIARRVHEQEAATLFRHGLVGLDRVQRLAHCRQRAGCEHLRVDLGPCLSRRITGQSVLRTTLLRTCAGWCGVGPGWAGLCRVVHLHRRTGAVSLHVHKRVDMLGCMDPLKLLHADAHLLVVDKPAGLLAVPGRGEGEQLNLTVQLRQRHPEALIVHRLDQATSGLMIFARSAAVQRALSMAFAARRVHKRYEAVVCGEVRGESGTITAPLIADWPQRPRQKVNLELGKSSCTRWRVLRRLSSATRLELEPVTGRSHQLRVHLQSIGHPIVGDTLYGDETPAADRLLLHATRLELLHPVTGEALSFVSDAPF